MMPYFFIAFLFVAVLLSSCTSDTRGKKKGTNSLNIKNKDHFAIEKLEISEFGAEPADHDSFTYKAIGIERDHVYLINYQYEGDILINRKIISVLNDLKESKILLRTKIDAKHTKDTVFGNPNAADEGGIKVEILLAGRNQFTWTLSHRKEELPPVAQLIYDSYYSLKKKLY